MAPALSPAVAGSFAQGFADPVHDSQAAFRAVMRAMARPGTIETLGFNMASPPLPLPVAAAAACLALADFETPLWLSPSLQRGTAIADYLRFHTGAPLANAPNGAAFVVVDARCDPLDLAEFAQGTVEYPDRGATVILICDHLGAELSLSLSGPGIQKIAELGFSPMPDGFAKQWAINRAAFPLGVDMILAASNTLACLPRSTRILAEAV